MLIGRLSEDGRLFAFLGAGCGRLVILPFYCQIRESLDESERTRVFENILHVLDAAPEEKISVLLSQLDQLQGLQLGSNLQYFRHLAAQSAFQWDMQSYLHSSLKAKDVTPSVYWLKKDVEYVHA